MSPVIIVNDSGMPDALFRAIQRQRRPFNPDPYSISITELLAPPRQRQLLRQAELSGTEIKIPASRLVAAFLGTCVHKGLEPADEDLTRGEERLRVTVGGAGLPCKGRWRVSGQPDLIDEHGIVHDYKLTKAYALKDGWLGPEPCEDGEVGDEIVPCCGKLEWVAQMNLYAELARRQSPPIAVTGLRLTAFIKDFREKTYGGFKATRVEYPWLTSETQTLHVPLWSQEEATAFLHERLAAHEAAMTELPPCTDEERWVNERTGQPNRCAGWCSAYAVCQQANIAATLALMYDPPSKASWEDMP